MHKLEYLWLDGCTPTQIRYKTKVVKEFGGLEGAPIWGFDGSSTQQADGSSSDCVLKPVRVYPNPLESNSSIVLCEVFNVDDTPHETNTRRKLEETITDIEDDKRNCEKNSDFGENFIKLSRDVHFLNDDRAKIKLEINNITGSKIKEIKEYTNY